TRQGVCVWKAGEDSGTAGVLVRRYDNAGRAAFSPDGRAVVVVEADANDSGAEARVWDAEKGGPLGAPTRLPYIPEFVYAPDAGSFLCVPPPAPDAMKVLIMGSCFSFGTRATGTPGASACRDRS